MEWVTDGDLLLFIEGVLERSGLSTGRTHEVKGRSTDLLVGTGACSDCSNTH